MSDSAYQPQSIDTSVESDRYQFKLLRQKTNGERFAMAAQMIRWAKTVSLRGIRKARGELAPEYFARAVLQEKWISLLTPSEDGLPGAIEDIQSSRGRVLSVTHMQLVLNADIVLNANTDFDRSKMERQRLEAIGLDESEQFWIDSPEDLILAKLLWGQQSQSEKQWRDVLGMLKVQGDSLDFAYLTQRAARLDLTKLVRRAIAAAGLEIIED